MRVLVALLAALGLGTLAAGQVQPAGGCPLDPSTITVQSCTQASQCALRICETAYCCQGNCVYFPKEAGDLCDDRIYCNGRDSCDGGGACTLHEGNPCLLGDGCNSVCNETVNNCYASTSTPCEDGLFCTESDRCNGQGQCVGGADPCRLNPVCTQQCDEQARNCSAPLFTDCSDGIFCNGKERCNGQGSCVAMPPPCEDLEFTACQAYCNETVGQCVAPAGTACEDDGSNCTVDVCSETGVCLHLHLPNATSCEDGQLCTRGDACLAGVCISGPFNCTCTADRDCDDGNYCTRDTCIVNEGRCEFQNLGDGTNCSDGKYCTGPDRCRDGRCTDHSGDPCISNTPCNNVCNEQFQSCLAREGTQCEDGLFCNGRELCDGSGNCLPGQDPCTLPCARTCSESNDSCFDPMGTSCSNGVWCDGEELCDGNGACVSSGPPCTLGTSCNSTCNEAVRNCHAQLGTLCEDNIWCNGKDVCSSGLCLHVQDPCGDVADLLDNSCIRDCQEQTRNCASDFGAAVLCYDAVNGSDCDAGDFCRGRKICNGGGSFAFEGNPCGERPCDTEQGACIADLTEGSSSEPPRALSAILIAVIGGFCCLILFCICAAWFRFRRRPLYVDSDGLVDLDSPESLASARGAYDVLDISASRPDSPSSPYATGPEVARELEYTPPRSRGQTRLQAEDMEGMAEALTAMVAASPLADQSAGWQIPHSELTYGDEVGAGSFGTVYSGVFRGGAVAIKTIQGTDLTQKMLDDFLAEAAVHAALRPHAAVVAFFGVSFGSRGVGIVSEFMKGGSLESVLRSSTLTLNSLSMLQWIRDIASGMSHISAERIVHRDLAARNVLLSSASADSNAKIADLGMARILSPETSQNATKNNTGPLKHMAPECLLQRTYSTKSDVFAFAVTVNEILTRDQPYPTLDAISAATQVTHGLRPQYPSNTFPPLLTLLTSCLSERPDDRPTFSEIVEVLAGLDDVLVDG